MVGCWVDENSILEGLAHCLFHEQLYFLIFLKRGYSNHRIGLKQLVLDVHIGKEFHRFELVNSVPVKLLNNFQLTVSKDTLDAGL